MMMKSRQRRELEHERTKCAAIDRLQRVASEVEARIAVRAWRSRTNSPTMTNETTTAAAVPTR